MGIASASTAPRKREDAVGSAEQAGSELSSAQSSEFRVQVRHPHPVASEVLPSNEPQRGPSHHLLLYAQRPGRLFRYVGPFLLSFSSSTCHWKKLKLGQRWGVGWGGSELSQGENDHAFTKQK